MDERERIAAQESEGAEQVDRLPPETAVTPDVEAHQLPNDDDRAPAEQLPKG